MIKINDFHKSRIEKERAKQKRIFSAAGNIPGLDTDLLDGLKRSVDDARSRMALEYVYAIILGQQAQIEELQSLLEQDAEPTLPGQPAPKPEPTKEAEPAEEKKKRAKPEPKTTDDETVEQGV